MAETVHLTLKAGGNAIKGESSQTSLDRKDTIECLSFEEAVASAREAGTGMATGRRQYQPVVIRKRIDSSSPLIIKALVENQVCDATFKFYRPNPSGDGTTEQFYSIQLKEARVSGVKEYVLDTTDPANHATSPLEEVSFVFHTISWTYTKGGITHEDTWSSNR